ncbi:MAG: glycosyltransferase [Geminicoccaceae bacterium]|nr:glycosyltransferase [Geminicoccaceae bacterium]
MQEPRVVAVIVTWNRKDLLARNLRAVKAQCRPVDEIVVIDNASTDGTPEMVRSAFPSARLLRLAGNAGAAGGMHVGMREALARGADWLWLMDDDGMPSATCLASLLRMAARESAALCGPLIRDIEEPDELAFPPPLAGLPRAVEPFKRAIGADWLPTRLAGLWNGVLVSAEAARSVGLPKAEMFIWGEEHEYSHRLTRAGYRTGIALEADYFHPRYRFPGTWLVHFEVGRRCIQKCQFCDPRSPRAAIYARNLGYNDRHYHGLGRVVARLVAGFGLCLLRTGPAGAAQFVRYYIDGLSDRYALEPSRGAIASRLAIAAPAQAS